MTTAALSEASVCIGQLSRTEVLLARHLPTWQPPVPPPHCPPDELFCRCKAFNRDGKEDCQDRGSRQEARVLPRGGGKCRGCAEWSSGVYRGEMTGVNAQLPIAGRDFHVGEVGEVLAAWPSKSREINQRL